MNARDGCGARVEIVCPFYNPDCSLYLFTYPNVGLERVVGEIRYDTSFANLCRWGLKTTAEGVLHLEDILVRVNGHNYPGYIHTDEFSHTNLFVDTNILRCEEEEYLRCEAEGNEAAQDVSQQERREQEEAYDTSSVPQGELRVKICAATGHENDRLGMWFSDPTSLPHLSHEAYGVGCVEYTGKEALCVWGLAAHGYSAETQKWYAELPQTTHLLNEMRVEVTQNGQTVDVTNQCVVQEHGHMNLYCFAHVLHCFD